MALLARTGNVNAEELYTFFTNDTNAQNNIISISGQVFYFIKFCSDLLMVKYENN